MLKSAKNAAEQKADVLLHAKGETEISRGAAKFQSVLF